jgi:hypothetical protein
MAFLFYLLRRLVAIALGLALTGYSAWASWRHNHDLIGPLAAVSAATLLAFCEYAWRDRHWVHFGLLGMLGIAAAAISGSVVLERVSHSQEARAQAARSANLPRQDAKSALDKAEQALDDAEAAASAKCSSGRGPACKALEQREEAARQRVKTSRAELVGLGAEVAVDPVAAILGAHAETIRLAVLLGLPLWLELAAPVVLAYGFAPAPRKAEPASRKVKRRRKPTRAPRKPAAPSAKAAARPPLKLVADNDH